MTAILDSGEVGINAADESEITAVQVFFSTNLGQKMEKHRAPDIRILISTS